MQKGFIRLGKVSINHILSEFVGGVNDKKLMPIIVKSGKTYNAKRNSQRYIIFKEKGLTCVSCGLTANKAYLEITKEDLKQNLPAHFNFYYVENGKEILFTKDHIIPKSKGGNNIQENYQTMCSICNCKKSSEIT